MTRKTFREKFSHRMISAKHPSKTPLIIVIAAVMMIAIHSLWPSVGFNVEDARELSSVQVVKDENSQIIDVESVSNENVAVLIRSSRVGQVYNYPLYSEYFPYDSRAIDEFKVRIPHQSLNLPKAVPTKPFEYALQNTSSRKARIAIVIDDVGMNRTQSKAVIDIKDVPMTLAFLPYAPNLSALTEPARAAGHELMIHMPMEPMDGSIDTGAIALKSNMDDAGLRDMLNKAFASFDGYVGLNNHMGSRLTQDKHAMDLVMDVLGERGLFYLDSKTISTSIAARSARESGLSHAERDVFLDHEDTLSFARSALKKLEKVALEKGHAIAIGHPKKNTVAALKEWIPTLEARGFEIVPVSDLLMHPQKGGVKVAIAKAKPVEVQQEAPKQAKKKPLFIKKQPMLQDIKPAAGEREKAEEVVVTTKQVVIDVQDNADVQSIAAEDLLSAPIGGLYSLSE